MGPRVAPPREDRPREEISEVIRSVAAVPVDDGVHQWAGAPELVRRKPVADVKPLWSGALVLAGLSEVLAAMGAGGGFLVLAAWILAVGCSGLACVLALIAADRSEAGFRRWRIQALADAVVMLLLMASGPTVDGADPARPAASLATAILLAALASAMVDGPRLTVRTAYLMLDAAVIASTVSVGMFVARVGSTLPALELGATAAACYALVSVALEMAARKTPGADSDPLIASLCLGAYALGYVGTGQGFAVPTWLGLAPVALGASLFLLRSSAGGLAAPPMSYEDSPAGDARVRLAPAVAAGSAIAFLSGVELFSDSGRAGFFGVVGLFVLVVTRLVVTLFENGRLARRVRLSGVFEEKLRDLGSALMAAPDEQEALTFVCRTAQMATGAHAVLLWMVDPSTREIEAAEVLGNKRRLLLQRRIPIDDLTSLAARVVRTGETEVVRRVSDANLSNGFLNVLLRAQSLLAVPVVRGDTVQGALVCVDSTNPNAYGPQDMAKAELLASQVAVALDNGYQHALQRRRLEEVTALYRFAQSAHTALSGPDIACQLLPILKQRLRYTYAAVWLRETPSGGLRLAAGDGPGGLPLVGVRPSRLAMRAINTGGPANVGLGWDDSDPATEAPERGGVQSQLAVPLMLKRRVVGVIDLESRQPNTYSLNDERLLVSLGNHAALAIDNLRLLDETRKVEALRELDRMKTELLGTVSHELRTPLTGIKGYATTLLTNERRLGRAEKREFLEIIDSEADRLKDLIENLLDLSRLEAGVLRIERSKVLLGPTAREVSRKVHLAAPDHAIELEWPEDQPVLADERRVYQIMQNLLTNAVKYSPDGGRIQLTGEFHSGELLISVVDDGLGMPVGELDRIFDRFHRVGGEVSQRIGGTGLGLAICKGLVEAHHGRIWAESGGEGLGSTFRFTLPATSYGDGSTHLAKETYGHQEATHRSRR